MSEPIRTSPAKRKQLAAALKRNMARRKAVAREDNATSPKGEGMPAQPLAATSRKGHIA